jgi:voltage-gated potassium channel
MDSRSSGHHVRSQLLRILVLSHGRIWRISYVLRVFHPARVAGALWRSCRHFLGVLRHNDFGYTLGLTALLVIAGGVGIWLVEPGIGSLEDGLWWGLVTTTTIGYGDIAPKTEMGRVIAAFLMILGIGTVSLMTATIASYFVGGHHHPKTNPHVEQAIVQLRRWDQLTVEERRDVVRVLSGLVEG